MQRQQETTQQQIPRRSVGELLVALLLMLWGAIWGILCAVDFFGLQRDSPIFQMHVLIVMLVTASVSTFAGGLFSLLRYRRIAFYFLMLASFCICIAGLCEFWLLGGIHFGLWILLPIVGILATASVVFFLGRWIDRQAGLDA